MGDIPYRNHIVLGFDLSKLSIFKVLDSLCTDEGPTKPIWDKETEKLLNIETIDYLKTQYIVNNEEIPVSNTDNGGKILKRNLKRKLYSLKSSLVDKKDVYIMFLSPLIDNNTVQKDMEVPRWFSKKLTASSAKIVCQELKKESYFLDSFAVYVSPIFYKSRGDLRIESNRIIFNLYLKEWFKMELSSLYMKSITVYAKCPLIKISIRTKIADEISKLYQKYELRSNDIFKSPPKKAQVLKDVMLVFTTNQLSRIDYEGLLPIIGSDKIFWNDSENETKEMLENVLVKNPNLLEIINYENCPNWSLIFKTKHKMQEKTFNDSSNESMISESLTEIPPPPPPPLESVNIDEIPPPPPPPSESSSTTELLNLDKIPPPPPIKTSKNNKKIQTPPSHKNISKIGTVVQTTPENITKNTTKTTMMSQSVAKIATPPKMTRENIAKIATPPPMTPENIAKIATPPPMTPENIAKIVTPPPMTPENIAKITTPPPMTPENIAKIASPPTTPDNIAKIATAQAMAKTTTSAQVTTQNVTNNLISSTNIPLTTIGKISISTPIFQQSISKIGTPAPIFQQNTPKMFASELISPQTIAKISKIASQTSTSSLNISQQSVPVPVTPKGVIKAPTPSPTMQHNIAKALASPVTVTQQTVATTSPPSPSPATIIVSFPTTSTAVTTTTIDTMPNIFNRMRSDSQSTTPANQMSALNSSTNVTTLNQFIANGSRPTQSVISLPVIVNTTNTAPKPVMSTNLMYIPSRNLSNVFETFNYNPSPDSDVLIHGSDLLCLNFGQYLNDNIINFYLNFIRYEIMSEDQRQRTHLFNVFFNTKLQGCPSTAATDTPEIRHARVAKWTKKVDIFDKDFIIIPINENQHWFLAIVCFPWMAGMVSYDKLLGVNPNQPPSIIPVNETHFAKKYRVDRLRRLGQQYGVKASPCILLFDSIQFHSRAPNVKLIREYLKTEWDSKRLATDGPLVFDKNTMRGFNPQVPQQTNNIDCGIFVLHYVEQFFNQPLPEFTKEYFQSSLLSWFHNETVAKKRATIQKMVLAKADAHQAQREASNNSSSDLSTTTTTLDDSGPDIQIL